MPTVIISPNASSTSNVVAIQPGVFEPKMQILKRPKDTDLPSSSSQKSMPGESLKERESRYQAARQRIFGEAENTAQGETNTILRQPTGPSESNPGSGSKPPKGFQGRGAGTPV